MLHRFAAVLSTILLAALLYPVSAQTSNVYSKAAPPEKAVLDRLNLKTEWSQFIPVEGARDAISQVQTIDDQVFVQTRTGFFIVLDAVTGKLQWTARLGNGSYGNSYPVAANAQFVFVAHITKLYAFYRYTGATEFVADLGTPPNAGLICDSDGVYCVVGMKPGSAGAHRIAVYNLPRPININDPGKIADDTLVHADKKSVQSPIDELTNRYHPGGLKPPPPDLFDPAYRPGVMQAPVIGTTGSKTPSVSTLPSVVPPYSLGNRAPAPSVNTLPSMRQPYQLRLDSGRYIQQTPSIGIGLPSVYNSALLSDLRPKSIAPPLRWEYGLTASISYQLNLTPTRAWAIVGDDTVIALNKSSTGGKVVTEVNDRLTAKIAARPSQSGLTLYSPMDNGTLISVDAVSGNLVGGLSLNWRADVGGINNRSPYITKNFVYAAGDNSGVICVNRADGEVIWRSDISADRVIGANEEFVYVRDRQGRFLVYDAKRATDPARKKAVPLGSANFSEFNVHIVNTASDRVYLAADNGLIVCLRDAAQKYAKPMVIWPPANVNPPKRANVDTQGGDKKEPGDKKD